MPEISSGFKYETSRHYRITIQVAEKLLRQMKRRDDDDDDFVETPAKTTKVKSAKSSRRQSSFAPSPAITPIAEEAVWSAPKKGMANVATVTEEENY